MKTKAFVTTKGFHQKSFQEDLKSLTALGDDQITLLTEKVATAKDLKALISSENLAELATQLKLQVEAVEKALGVGIFIARAVIYDKVTTQDLLEDMVEADIIALSAISRQIPFVDACVSKIHSMREERVPSMPLLYIKEISTECVMISEFNKEFDTEKDAIGTYMPEVSKLYPVATLKLKFFDDEHEPIGIALKKNDLDILIKWLQLTKVQLSKLEDSVILKNISTLSQDIAETGIEKKS